MRPQSRATAWLCTLLANLALIVDPGAAYAADLIWEVESPFRFFKPTRSFALHEAAFQAVRGGTAQPLPADIIWRTERALKQRIVGFNKGAEDTFGYLAEEVLGKPLVMLMPQRFADSHGDHVRSFAEGRVSGRLMGGQRVVFGRRRDGTEFPAEASITKLEIDGRPVLTAILRDATERQRTEAFGAAVGEHLVGLDVDPPAPPTGRHRPIGLDREHGGPDGGVPDGIDQPHRGMARGDRLGARPGVVVGTPHRQDELVDPGQHGRDARLEREVEERRVADDGEAGHR